MFRVSFNASASDLHTVLLALPDSLDVSIEPIRATQRVSKPNELIAPVRKKRGPYKKRPTQEVVAVAQVSNNGQIINHVRQLIETFGVPPFKSSDLVAHAAKLGVGSPSVYRTLRTEVKAGRLKKIEAGRYQRTSGSWVNQLGFGT